MDLNATKQINKDPIIISNLRVNTVKENNFNRDIFKSYIKTVMNKVDKNNILSLEKVEMK